MSDAIKLTVLPPLAHSVHYESCNEKLFVLCLHVLSDVMHTSGIIILYSNSEKIPIRLQTAVQN